MTGASGSEGGSQSEPPHRPASLGAGVRPGGKSYTAPQGGQEESREQGRDSASYDGQGSQSSESEGECGTSLRDAQSELNYYRQNLAWDLEVRDMSSRVAQSPMASAARVSPIQEQEETSPSPPEQPDSGDEPTTTSTESGKTIRGGMTPGFMPKTPSYPFPRMTSASPGGFIHPSMHRPFTTLSPTTGPSGLPSSFEAPRGYDNILSNSSTPASATTFLPRGYSNPGEGVFDFPAPNLYDISLMLSAEPGLEAWWNTVVQIMTELYQAERVTLAVPADSTDIENVPWGQKATFNMHQGDGMSLGYMARGSSLVPSSKGDVSESVSQSTEELAKQQQQEPARPGLQSRHSFTSYEDRERSAATALSQAHLRRPNMPSRSKTTHPTLSQPELSGDDGGTFLNRRALEEHDAQDDQQEIPNWEAPITNRRPGQGKVMNVLQALNYEADPLIDHNGVHRVLERGRVVALTRTYPYLGSTPPVQQATTPGAKPTSTSTSNSSQRRPRRPRSDSTSKLSSGRTSSGNGHGQEKKSTPVGARIDDDNPPRPPTPKYEEYEQTPQSPWAQSPAPSPAARSDSSDNPFFTDAMVDEESFNPAPIPPDYTDTRQLQAIGVDNSWTVLHIPLTHVFLSKPNPAFKLDSTIMEQKISARSRTGDTTRVPTPSQDVASKEKHAPIAILSILSPIIPYPSNLRHSLEHLAPHLATSFSLCRHYTNLEIEISGMKKRRPVTAGFGAIGPDGRLLADPAALASLGYPQPEDNASRGSMGGSMTSPSDYSAPSRSAAGSPTGTPAWDPHALGLVMGKRTPASSPAPMSGDSYFNTRPSITGGSGNPRARRNSRDSSTGEKRSSLRLSGGKSQLQDLAFGPSEHQVSAESASRAVEDSPTSPSQQRRQDKEQKEYSPTTTPDVYEGQNQRKQPPGPLSSTQHRHTHTQLHSYGADFASTFQSLTPSASIGKAGPQPPAPSRSGSVSQATEMTPPSDKLKGLMLDSLPAHVFVALPQTGEIVWVNSRFLTYRGQSSCDLAADPWGSIHPDDRQEYLRTWTHCVRTGEQFSRTVRIRRFDGAYRWFYARAVASKDKRGVIMQFLGSYMDIHDQHIAEVRAARQEEIEASEAKHRLLANLIPQIIFTATEDEGITFANEQWLSYTGQTFEDVLGLGFMDYVHPDDIAKCQIPISRPATPPPADLKTHDRSASLGKPATSLSAAVRPPASDSGARTTNPSLSRNNSSGSSSINDVPNPNLTELAKLGVIKVSTDSNGRLSYTTEIRLRSKSGDYRWHLIRCVEIDNVDFGNGVSSYFGSATDINDLKLLETKLKEAMESKGRFLSNMSHEIRTPLIGISGMVSFLQDTTLTEEQRDYTNTIQTSANSLIMIINDILDLSKVDAGMMKLSYEWFHTRSLIEDVNELVSTMAIAKRLELNYVVEEDVPTWVKGDKVRIRQVLLNVIGNAIKFTSEGEVFSRCKVVVPEDGVLNENEIMLEFSITDTGRGFTKEEADLIFKPFSQIDGSSTRQHGGSGLGLVISRQLVELHGGKMEGSAAPGKGSTFTFTARFGLPEDADHPELAFEPQPTALIPEVPFTSTPSPFNKPVEATSVSSPPSMESGSPAVASTGSSAPSLRSTDTEVTSRSSMSSVNAGLVRFSEAARASGQDLSQMKFEMPRTNKSSSGTTPTPGMGAREKEFMNFRPPMYSILVICPQTLSREATTKHIEMTLPKDIPHQITALGSVDEAKALIGGEDPVVFTHVVVNLPSPEEIISLMDEIMRSAMVDRATIVILSDSVQRQAVLKQATGTMYQEILSEHKVTYIYKPVKPSRFAVIFDPAKERDFSIDRNRSTAQRLVEDQKQSYIDMEKKIGNRGYKVLLVEDNPVNQKVLQKYLRKVGLVTELAVDGVECTETVLAREHGYYSLILCDLHMPRKDGYQACREIREWEAKNGHKRMPIIALSANVMSDVQEKCVEAGFSNYVTKPVDFIDLSNALSKFF